MTDRDQSNQAPAGELLADDPLPVAYYQWLATIEPDVRARDLTTFEVAELMAALTRPSTEARVRELEAALEPFAKAADDIEREYGERPVHQFQFPPLTMLVFTRARAALKGTPDA